MRARTPLTATGGVLVVALALTGCGSGGDGGAGSSAVPGAPTVTIVVSDDGCTPSPATVPAGPLTFAVSNETATRVTEAEVMQDGRILAEKENLTPGLSGSFSLNLEGGDYTVYCPNATTDQSPLKVTAGASSTASADASLTAAVANYRAFLKDEADSLLAATTTFAKAVSAGDLTEAKALYPAARAHYEIIEPVAESFGDLDPKIDARVNDVAAGDAWTGFHRIEKALWADGSTAGMTPIATQLVTDVTTLVNLIPTAKLQPATIANGAVDLLGEVANSKITGEEDRYSHTDLWDFEANVAGARESLAVLTPALKARDPQLLATAQQQFAAVLSALSPYQTSSGYVAYTLTTVPQDQRRALTTLVNRLAETLSKVAPVVVQS